MGSNPAYPASRTAGLQPPFQPGNKLPRRSDAVNEAIRELRRWSPRAVRFLGRIMEDDKQATTDRVRAATALLDKIIPDASVKDPALLIGAGGVTSITLKVVRAEQPAGPVIEGQAEEQPAALLSIRTVCQGEGDD